nr:upf0674 endoplasmic reticulum membrane protein [Quercus suber]
MAGIINAAQLLFGGGKSSVSSVATDIDADFADFATPVPPAHAASGAPDAAQTATNPLSAFKSPMNFAGRPYTKWYRVWERATLADFYQEMFIIPCIIVIVLVNVFGTRVNRSRAGKWAEAHMALLESEYAVVGFGGRRTTEQGKAVQKQTAVEQLLKEKSKSEFITYCTGRQNVAWLDVKLNLYPRYNPLRWAFDVVLSFFFDTMPAPAERIEATAYCFDGKEKSLVPAQSQLGTFSGKDSSYDGFVWAIVHKDKMNQLRTDRYDLSLASTKDHPKLPIWTTVMSESAEVTEAMLTPELIKAVESAGENLEALIVSDQNIDAPKTLNDTIPRKRVSLSMHVDTSSSATNALFAAFLRLPDHLVNTAHFRPEALRKVRATREEEMRRIRKIDEVEKAAERREMSDKTKKEERDRKLSRMSADEQKKFLKKEKDLEQKRNQKKMTTRA